MTFLHFLLHYILYMQITISLAKANHISMELQFFHAYTILLVLASFLQPTLSNHPRNSSTDLKALLSFKSHLVDPNGVLKDNWMANSSFCNWFGVTCNRNKRVVGLVFQDTPLQGTISPHLGNFSFIRTLFLANTSLGGQIPESIGKLPRLTTLVLQINFLSGRIPSTIFNMSLLTQLSFATNNLSGAIPSYLNHTLPLLVSLSLTGNHFRGDDALLNLARCRSLEMLSLSNNFFSGSIPNEIGSLSELTRLSLGGNYFTGTIPTSLGNLTKLDQINLSACNLTGVIPKELVNLVNLNDLRLEMNNLTGTIPVTLMNTSKLSYVDFSHNKLIGNVPIEIGKSLPSLQFLSVANNQLSGGLGFLSSFSNCKNLTHLQFQSNNLKGRIPEDVGKLPPKLYCFFAYDNHISGNIPDGLGNLTSLGYLDLHNNELVGNLPMSFSRLRVGYMSLSSNRLSGSIPAELGAIKSMSSLYLADNLFSGAVPESLSNMSFLQHLDLGNNKLSSCIPKSLWALVNLLYLNLSRNSLNGSLPPEIGNLKDLTILDLSVNNISGYISSSLGNLLMLSELNLSRNSFSSEIPESFGKLISLTYLNLSYNSLSKSIPKSLANLSKLNVIDLSYNKLEGQVPNGKLFSNSTTTYLFGNKALCGAQRFKPCNTDTSNHNPKGKSLLITLGILLCVVLLVFVCFICAYFSYKKHKPLPNSCNPLLEYNRVISRYELARATNNFSEENLLGRGGFSSVFKGSLDDGLIVAVKVFNLDIEDVPKTFNKECQVLAMVRHRNLIKTISACSNMEFKAIVLEFMPNGNLEQWLYSTNCYMDMNQRLNIIVDVASALEYLHHRHPHVILHCDLKPTNVLLDENFIAHVGDFGVSRLMNGENQSTITASMPGTIGYIAPEYSCNGAISKMSDVYSFGILLLEIFTKKKPTDDMFGEESSLRDWICKAHPHAILDVVDSKLIEKNDRNMHSSLLSVIELGLLCSQNSPKERIPMTDVSKRLQKIKMEYLTVS